MSEEENFSRYHEALERGLAQPPCVPFLGVFLSKVVQLDAYHEERRKQEQGKKGEVSSHKDNSSAPDIFVSSEVVCRVSSSAADYREIPQNQPLGHKRSPSDPCRAYSDPLQIPWCHDGLARSLDRAQLDKVLGGDSCGSLGHSVPGLARMLPGSTENCPVDANHKYGIAIPQKPKLQRTLSEGNTLAIGIKPSLPAKLHSWGISEQLDLESNHSMAYCQSLSSKGHFVQLASIASSPDSDRGSLVSPTDSDRGLLVSPTDTTCALPSSCVTDVDDKACYGMVVAQRISYLTASSASDENDEDSEGSGDVARVSVAFRPRLASDGLYCVVTDRGLVAEHSESDSDPDENYFAAQIEDGSYGMDYQDTPWRTRALTGKDEQAPHTAGAHLDIHDHESCIQSDLWRFQLASIYPYTTRPEIRECILSIPRLTEKEAYSLSEQREPRK